MPSPAENLYEPAVIPPADQPAVRVAGHFRQDAAYRILRPRGTDDWLLTYTVAGLGRYGLRGGGTRRAEPGDLCLLPPGAQHDYGTDPDAGVWEFWWAHFLPRPPWRAWLGWPEDGSGLRVRRLGDPRARPRMRRAWERAVADRRGMGALAGDLALNALEEVLLLAWAGTGSGAARGAAGTRAPGAGIRAAGPAARTPAEPRVLEVLDHLAAHLAEPHSLAALAARVALSPSRLGHLVREQTGASLGQTLTALRLREAARLLRFTERTVGEVAADVGFASPFYFSRRFAARYGMPPRAYRARYAERAGARTGPRRTVDP